MQTYKVQNKQNIYDIAVHLFGSIEGVFELLANNPDLSYDKELRTGDVLYYDEKSVIFPSIVDEINQMQFIPRNSERNVYYKETKERIRCKIKIPADCVSFVLHVSGNNNMIIDWGDNTPLEEIVLQPTEKEYIHFFNNQTTQRTIRLYGEFEIKTLSLSNISGEILPVNPIVVDEFISQKNNIPLQCLFLFNGTYRVDLSDMVIDSLNPIRDMSLSYLKLSNNVYIKSSCIDDYLIYIATHHNQRRNCHVVLDTKPSGVYQEPKKNVHGNYIITSGMEAIYVILHEPAWNEAGPWVFDINGVEYAADNISFNYKLSFILE